MNKDQILLNILNEDAKVVNKKILLKRLEGSVVTITGASGLVGLNITTALIKYNELADKAIRVFNFRYVMIRLLNFTAQSTA